MPLWDGSRLTHTADLYTVTSSTDAGGGVTLAYTLAQSSIKCIANSVSASEQARFAAMQIIVTHRVSFLTSDFTTTPARGMKLVVNGNTLHIKGINSNQAMGTIPALTEILCEQIA